MAPDCVDGDTANCCTSCARQYSAMHDIFTRKKNQKTLVKAYNSSIESFKTLPDTVQAHLELGTERKTQHETTISLQLLAEFFRLYRIAHFGNDTRAHKQLIDYIMGHEEMKGKNPK